jgi:hypothetical protein
MRSSEIAQFQRFPGLSGTVDSGESACACYDLVTDVAEGAPLTRDESKVAYAVIRHNVRTYESGGVVEVVKGRQNAEATMSQFEGGQTSEDRQLGWRYFLEKTEMLAGTSPEEATHRRQMELEVRESKALEPPTTIV